MTRLELLTILVGQARINGFEFRRWFTTRLALPWNGSEAALVLLETHRRYYALLFSHDFAESFWKPGATMTFQVEPKPYERRMSDGTIRTVKSAPYKRRSARPDAWRYHLREMALADEPLRYMRRYLNVEDDADDEKADQSTALVVKLNAAAEPRPEKVEAAVIPTLARAREAHARRQLARKLPFTSDSPRPVKRGARPPGSPRKPSRPSAKKKR